ncbi:MAG: hypothetical protein PWQ67_150 [Clostridia bacterium]|jgi:hypothetical protein|nr:hypothetical protein [Clostridia bacterium]MDN5321696.1 hypothetical protein [Clostridia bacterium]
MKKSLVLTLAGLLILGLLATTAFAETANQVAPQFPQAPNQEFFQQMWNFCHGPNGMMNYYYGNGNVPAAPQGFYGGMMGW